MDSDTDKENTGPSESELAAKAAAEKPAQQSQKTSQTPISDWFNNRRDDLEEFTDKVGDEIDDAKDALGEKAEETSDKVVVAQGVDDNLYSDTLAKNIVKTNTNDSVVNYQGIAADIVHIGRTNTTGLDSNVYNAAKNHIEETSLKTAVDTELSYEHQADATLFGNSTPAKVDPVELEQITEDLLDSHTKVTRTATNLDINSLAYDVEQLAEKNPSLAVATKSTIGEQLTASQASDLNRIVSGNATITENIEVALENPVDGIIGAGKGVVNGFSAIGELFVKGTTMNAASQQQQAAGISSLLGNERLAEQQMTLGAELQETALHTDFVPDLPMDNRAQQGGETVGMVIDVAMAGKGLVAGGAKVLAKNADELAQAGAKLSDDVAQATTGTVYRGDSFPNSYVGKTPARRKSHIDEAGNWRPANSDGTATPTQHVRGSESAKSNSPYTSFSASEDTAKEFGRTVHSVDIETLRTDIKTGKVNDVEIVEHDDLMKIHQKNVDRAENRYNASPTEKNSDRLSRAQDDKNNSLTQQEYLVKGVIPAKYVNQVSP